MSGDSTHERLAQAAPLRPALEKALSLVEALISHSSAAIWRLLPTEECALCCEDVFFLRFHRNPLCMHRCCSTCWRRFLAAGEVDTLRRMQTTRAFTLCCWGCDMRLERQLVRRFAPLRLRTCIAQIELRERLIERAPPWCTIVECPQMGCVGVGYDDNRTSTIMCWICEHQWRAPRGLMGRLREWVASWWPAQIDGVRGWRPCPHCGAAILKDGGCPMMRCGMCQQTFRWGMMGNSLNGVIEAHAPDARPRRRGFYLNGWR